MSKKVLAVFLVPKIPVSNNSLINAQVSSYKSSINSLYFFVLCELRVSTSTNRIALDIFTPSFFMVGERPHNQFF